MPLKIVFLRPQKWSRLKPKKFVLLSLLSQRFEASAEKERIPSFLRGFSASLPKSKERRVKKEILSLKIKKEKTLKMSPACSGPTEIPPPPLSRDRCSNALKMAYRGPKTGLTRGVLQKKLLPLKPIAL